MKAALLLHRRLVIRENAFAELVIWQIPKPARGSDHCFKYALAYVVNQLCVLRYDNEAGKGDHRHWGTREFAYTFTGIAALLDDFERDIRRWNDENGNA